MLPLVGFREIPRPRATSSSSSSLVNNEEEDGDSVMLVPFMDGVALKEAPGAAERAAARARIREIHTVYISHAEQVQLLLDSRVTEDERRALCFYSQGDPRWRAARDKRVTGTLVAKILGHVFMRQSKAEQLAGAPPRPHWIAEWLWPADGAGNEAMAFGTDHEPNGLDVLTQLLKQTKPRARVRTNGLKLHKEFQWLGYSADCFVQEQEEEQEEEKEEAPVAEGEAKHAQAVASRARRRQQPRYRGLGEIKCPFPSAEKGHVVRPYSAVPLMYYDQIQYGMWLTKRTHCYFLSWTAGLSRLTFVPYHQDYVEEFMLPEVNECYFGTLLPLLVAKQRGMLQPGEWRLPSWVVIEPHFPKLDLREPTRRPIPPPEYFPTLADPIVAKPASPSASLSSSAATPTTTTPKRPRTKKTPTNTPLKRVLARDKREWSKAFTKIAETPHPPTPAKITFHTPTTPRSAGHQRSSSSSSAPKRRRRT